MGMWLEGLTVEQVKAVLKTAIQKMEGLNLDPSHYYEASTDSVLDLREILSILNTPQDLSGILPSIQNFPPNLLTPPAHAGGGFVAGVVIVEDPARKAEREAAIAELKRVIANMEARGLDAHRLYDIAKDQIIDLYACLAGWNSGPNFAV